MGGISYIVCEKELPLPQDLGEDFNDIDWETLNFQSNSLEPDGLFGKYCITEDGQIYKEEVDFELEIKLKDGGLAEAEVNEKRMRGIERQDITAEVIFSYLHLATRYDYWIEFKALFFKGELKELTLLNWEKEDSKRRVELEAKIAELAKKQGAKEKTLLGKLVIFCKKTIGRVLWTIRLILGSFLKITFKIERWIY